MARQKPSFEEALAKLETLAEQIEKGQIGLEESIRKYEEGVALVNHCRDILARAEHRIEQLQPQPDGTIKATPLDATPPAS